MIELDHVTKRYTIQPGVVTGFLGPNGAGKSTAMQLMVGLDAPSRGDVRVNGMRYRDLRAPLHEVGAMLEARAIHTGRTASHHLLALAQTRSVPPLRGGHDRGRRCRARAA